MSGDGHTCPDCLRWFATAAELREHRDSKHGIEVIKKGH